MVYAAAEERADQAIRRLMPSSGVRLVAREMSHNRQHNFGG